MRREEQFKRVLDYFITHAPVARTELHYGDTYQLAVAVILSAQCTDKRVNTITPALFERFPTVDILSIAEPDEVFSYIKSCSYPNNKAKNLVNMAQKVVQDFGGHLPDEVEKLKQIPGLGRKSANVIASVAFHKPVIAVDTHVFRVSARLGLTLNAKTPLETEKQLVNHIPEALRAIAHHWLILHGRYVCQARKPKCSQCGLYAVCAYKKKE